MRLESSVFLLVKPNVLCIATGLLCCLSLNAFASKNLDAQSGENLPKTVQQEGRKVTVIVSDQLGEVTGANVVVKGTTNGSVTDLNGKVTLEDVPSNAVLQISFIGYQTMEVPVNGQENIRVQLIEDSQALDEVVVVGYGTMEKKMVTSSVSTIKGDKLFVGMGGSTIATALQGKISGLTISGTSSPNSSNDFQLRGVASVNASKGPLIVIDGIPGGDIRSLNQEDIESVDVLKDASAGAIYGTRAAGGVILITTKQAKEGRLQVTYTGEIAKEVVRKRPDMLNAEQYVSNGLGTDYGSATDWYDELINHGALSNRHVLSLSGGSDLVRVYSSFSYQNQEGIVIGDGRKDYSGRLNAQFNLFDGKVQFTTNNEYREANRDQRNSEGVFNMALSLNPTIPLMDPENPSKYNVVGNGISGTDFNPVADIMLRENNGKDQWLTTNATLKVNLTDELNVQGTLGYQKSQWQQYKYVSPEHKESVDNTRKGMAYHGFSKDESLSAEIYATYHKTFKADHTLNAVAGYSFWEANGESFNMTNYDFPVEGVGPWDMASGLYLTDGRAAMQSAKKPRERLLSFFGRVDYNYKGKYMLMASLRHEGSSKFSKNHRWGNFWAVSGGWRLSEEDFMKDVTWINDLKLRAGYGVTGNNGFSTGYSTRMYASSSMWPLNGVWDASYGSIRNINPDLKWEQKAEFNVGLDYAVLNNRFYGKFDWYVRKVSDMLYEVNAPMPPMVHKTVMKNIGNLRNTGWEFELGADAVRTDRFNYSTTLRLSQNKSKLLNIGLGDKEFMSMVTFPSPGNPGDGARLQNNLEIGQFFVFKHAGIDENGNWLIYDKDDNVVEANDKTLVADNKRYIGNAIPRLILSWDHNFQYRNWDLGISLRSWLNFDVFSQVNMYYGLKNKSQMNVLQCALDKNKDITAEKILSSYWIEDGSFLKIDAVTLGYRLNLKSYNNYVDNIRLYCTIRDLAVLTGYSGSNPEVDTNGLTPGFEYIKSVDSMYPQTIRFTFGAQINF